MGHIVAIVTTHEASVAGGAPIFIAKGLEELNRKAFLLEKILDASAHDLGDGNMILVDHEK